jgi:hypothetical protein
LSEPAREQVKVQVADRHRSQVVLVEISLEDPISKHWIKDRAKHLFTSNHHLDVAVGLRASVVDGELERLEALQREQGLLPAA